MMLINNVAKENPAKNDVMNLTLTSSTKINRIVDITNMLRLSVIVLTIVSPY